MATTTIKATYSLDPDTVRLLERTARRWRVSKSEALRRAIRAAALADMPNDAEALLDSIQALFRTWLRERAPLAISSVAWTEFMCGPRDGRAPDLVESFFTADFKRFVSYGLVLLERHE